ncbi:lanthionine synthetase [Spongiactinospora gelatinilytica]|uniref:Lanthionine synthetase n=1 Tax=Spongiactinospora gelatinilytica TaxID=2666298 RepID=A0A2W2FMV8_9ACTN|nr:lanthionine synthetase C family protein [Spongiactinospora gelatinilytica]PZG37093.1 lanthionine synthetase [Spongiactinospora gelatinilytica]
MKPQEAGQSLATGAAGTALLHIERALAGTGDWATADVWVRRASEVIDTADHAGLFYGVPAIAFVLHAGGTRYRSAAAKLDEYVLRLARRRLVAATARMDRGKAATFREYDLFSGLTGIGALLLRRMPGNDVLADILRYLIRLTRPRRDMPGWWVEHDPDPTLPTPGGHANLGIAHGAAGILALLALAARAGHVVDGQREAIERLADWFDQWRQPSPHGPWWPQWVTRDELRTGRTVQPGPGRPSWCYGAVGIARACQLAAIVTDDLARRRAAEEVMVGCLDARQLRRLSEPGLCHGLAGVYQTAYRASQDALSPEIAARLPTLVAEDACGDGLLAGEAGVRLAMETAHRGTPPLSGWDVCLLIT